MSKVPTLEDVRKALSGVKGNTFHIDGGLVYVYHSILHDENHPIDLRYNNTNLYIQIKRYTIIFFYLFIRDDTSICQNHLVNVCVNRLYNHIQLLYLR
jgi:hypothetical protein